MDVAAKDATDSAETVDVVDVTADADAAKTDVASAKKNTNRKKYITEKKNYSETY